MDGRGLCPQQEQQETREEINSFQFKTRLGKKPAVSQGYQRKTKCLDGEGGNEERAKKKKDGETGGGRLSSSFHLRVAR